MNTFCLYSMGVMSSLRDQTRFARNVVNGHMSIVIYKIEFKSFPSIQLNIVAKINAERSISYLTVLSCLAYFRCLIHCQTRNQLMAPGGAKSFLRGSQIF